MARQRRYRGEMSGFVNNFMDWATVNGFQSFFQPNTVDLPAGVTLNQYGWINCPTTAEIVIPLISLPTTEKRKLYWYSEKIVCNSPSPVRMSLEGNFQYDEDLGGFPADTWTTTAGYTVSDTHSHEWQGIAPILTIPGEALRLRVFPGSGNSEDFYFKFIAFDVPD